MRRVLLACLCLAGLLGVGWLWQRNRQEAVRRELSRTFIVGFRSSGSNEFLDAQGRATGISPEVLNEAARRTGIRLEWRLQAQGVDESFAGQKIDLWPAAGATPERLKKFHITEPWRRDLYSLVSRASDRILEPHDMAHRTISYYPDRWTHRLIAEHFPAMKKLEIPDQVAALAKVCQGEADAAILYVNPTLLDPLKPSPECRQTPLRMLTLYERGVGYGIAASRERPGAVAAAEKLREAVGEMGRDGTLAGQYMRWFAATGAEGIIMERLNEARRQNWYWAIGSLVELGLVVALIVLTGRYRRASAEARTASLAKSEFLANMSHELRTPMNGILGMVEVMEGTELNPSAREGVDIIKGSAKSLMRLLNDILDLARIEAGRLEIHVEALNPEREIREAVAIFGARAHQKGLELEVEMGAAVPRWILADPLRLRQVVTNLTANAVKFTASGKVLVGARLDEALGLVVSVRDTGPGISEENAARLFAKFSRLDTAEAKMAGGAGLGLAISQELVRAMGGTLRLESRLGEGSTFWFHIPLNVTDPPAQPANDVTDAEDNLAGMNVLLVEDHPVNRKVMEALLTKAGATFEVAHDGEEAVRHWLAGRYHAILMDCSMPVMDGFEASRQIRHAEGPQGMRTPIIALTANAMQGDRERCLAAGMDEFLSKPVDRRQLIATVRRSVAKPVGMRR